MKNRVLVFAVLAIVASFVASCAPRDPAGVATRFVKLIDAGELGKAADLVHVPPEARGPEAQAKVNMMLTGMVSEFAEKGGLASVETGEPRLDGENATVPLILRFRNGTVRKEKLDLIRTEVGWLIRLDGGK